MEKLTEKQKRFVEEYLKDLNASAAVSRSAYNTRNTAEIGYQLLQKENVQEYVQMLRNEQAQKVADIE